MIKIKRGALTIEIADNSFIQIQDTSDGMFFKTKDNTEIRMEVPVTPQVKAIPNMIMKSTAKNIIIDFNSKNLISFNN